MYIVHEQACLYVHCTCTSLRISVPACTGVNELITTKTLSLRLEKQRLKTVYLFS